MNREFGCLCNQGEEQVHVIPWKSDGPSLKPRTKMSLTNKSDLSKLNACACHDQVAVLRKILIGALDYTAPDHKQPQTAEASTTGSSSLAEMSHDAATWPHMHSDSPKHRKHRSIHPNWGDRTALRTRPTPFHGWRCATMHARSDRKSDAMESLVFLHAPGCMLDLLLPCSRSTILHRNELRPGWTTLHACRHDSAISLATPIVHTSLSPHSCKIITRHWRRESISILFQGMSDTWSDPSLPMHQDEGQYRSHH